MSLASLSLAADFHVTEWTLLVSLQVLTGYPGAGTLEKLLVLLIHRDQALNSPGSNSSNYPWALFGLFCIFFFSTLSGRLAGHGWLAVL